MNMQVGRFKRRRIWSPYSTAYRENLRSPPSSLRRSVGDPWLVEDLERAKNTNIVKGGRQ
jgi:hypothetical protein